MDKNPKVHSGHFERTRQRLLLLPTSEFTEIDVLEGLLQFVYLRADTNEIARNLLYKFKNISTIAKTSQMELQKVKGVGELASKKLVVLFRSLDFIKRQQSSITYEIPNTVSNAYRLVSKHFENLHNEELQAFYLDMQNNLIYSTIITQGGNCDVVTDYNKICEQAQRFKSIKVIIAHNHPTGDPTPSMEDFNCTSKLYGMLRSIDIRLIDHIVIGDKKFFSFNASKVLSYIAQMYDEVVNNLSVNYLQEQSM